MPKSVQPKVKADIHDIWLAETRADAEKAIEQFAEKYGTKYSAACERIETCC